MNDLPLALALVAGAVAAFNPCGFALLPSYLALLVAGEGGTGGAETASSGAVHGPAARSLRALRFATGMTLGFVAVFGAFGTVVAPLAISVERWLPVLTLVVGVVLVGLGVRVLSGRPLGGVRLPLLGRAPTAGFGSQVGYGVAFALASLSCTIAPFLAVTSTALRDGSVGGVLAVFVAYALGMGAVVLVLAVAVAAVGGAAAARVRSLTAVLTRASGALLLVAGAYVAWYGWFELRVLAGGDASDPVVAAATEVQGALTRAVAAVPPGALLAALAVAAAVPLLLAARRRSSWGAWQDARRRAKG